MRPFEQELVRYLLRRGHVTGEQVEVATTRLRRLAEAGFEAGMADVLVRMGFVPADVCREALVAVSPPAPERADSMAPGHASGGSEDAGHASGRTRAEDARKTFGPYEIISEISRGGAGVVYRAWDTRARRKIALKILLPKGGSFSDTRLKRFRREVQLAATFSHPNIVGIHASGEEEGIPYYTMDLVEGQELGDILEKGEEPWPVETVLRTLIPICDAIQHAHDHGVVHRDLKPQNILMHEDGRPLVTDFGLARALQGDSDLTRTGVVIGTPYYLSPEQSRGAREIDERSDVWALGVIMYQMLTLSLPFVASELPALYGKICNQSPDPPRALRPDIPADVERICLRAMEKHPDDRYQTVDAMRADLRRVLEGESIERHRVGLWRRGRRWASRKPLLAAGLAVLILVLLGGGGTLLSLKAQWDREAHQKAIEGERKELRKRAQQLPGRVERAESEAVILAEKGEIDGGLAVVEAALGALDRFESRATGPEHEENEGVGLGSVNLDRLRGTLFLTRARLHARAGREKEALSWTEQAISLRPDRVAAHLLRGKLLASAARPEEARAAFDLAVSLDEASPTARLARARFHLSRNEPSRAFEDLSVLRDLKGEALSTTALLLEAEALRRMGRPEEAFGRLSDNLQEPDGPEILVAAARALEDLERDRDALLLLTRAIEEYPRIAAPRYAARARFFRRTARPLLALDDIDRACGLDRDSVPYHLLRFELFAVSGRDAGTLIDELLAYEEETALTGEEVVRLRLLLGELHLRLGKMEEAERIYDELGRAAPDVPEVHVRLGQMASFDQRTAEAAEHLRRALEIDPRYPRAIERLAYAQWLLKQFPEARRHAEALLERFPDRVGPLMIRGLVKNEEEPKSGYGDLRRAAEIRRNQGGDEGYLLRKVLRMKTLLVKTQIPLRGKRAFAEDLAVSATRLMQKTVAPAEALLAMASAISDPRSRLSSAAGGVKLNPALGWGRVLLAQVLAQRDRYEAAARHFRAAIELEGADVRLLNDLGVTLYRMEAYAEALTRFEEVLKKDPTNRAALSNRVLTLKRLERPEEEIEAARQEFRRLTVERKRKARKAYEDALQSRREGDYDLAVQQLEEAIEHGHDTSQTYVILSQAYFFSSRFMPSMMAIMTAVMKNPKWEIRFIDDMAKYRQMGGELGTIERFNVVIEEALAREPNRAEAILLRGIVSLVVAVYFEKDATKVTRHLLNAIRDLDNVIERRPDFVLGHIYRGLAYYRLGFHRRAEREWMIARRMNANVPVLHLYEAIQLANRGRKHWEDAIASLRQAVAGGISMDNRFEKPLFPEPFRGSRAYREVVKRR